MWNKNNENPYLLLRHSGESRNPVQIEEMQPCVYILASERNGTLYVGVTSNLVNRIWEHKSDLVDGFSKKYRVHTLVWLEQHETMESAIQREKQIKKWKRDWKLELIENTNPQWEDLYPEFI
jgi:putative endonuclease